MGNDEQNKIDDKRSVGNFMQLVFENDRRIYGYIYVLVPNQAEADDLFQDTVTIMWEKYGTFIPDSDFGAWGIGIAYNLVRNYRRKRARSHVRFSEDVEQLIEHEASSTLSNLDIKINALRNCLSKLNPEEKDVIKLKYEYNCSTKEIAGKIGRSIKVVYIKLAKANDFLLRCIRRTLIMQDS